MSLLRSSDADDAISLAAELVQEAARQQTSAERRQQSELDRMIGYDADKATLVEMTDQAFRTHTPARVADQLVHLLDAQGIPRFFSPIERAMLKGFQSFGEYLPGVSVPLVKEKMRQETANVILPADAKHLTGHLRARQEQGVSMNVNLLGEALLGEQEAQHRLQQYRDLLRLPEVRCVSVKLSTLSSQVSPLARRKTIQTVANRLTSLYQDANASTEPTTELPKFVYLDMEEYADLYLTAEVLRRALDQPGMERTAAGIALQAYVPDSFEVMQQLIEWSADRVRRGGEPLTIRLVKGANMEMERVHASIAGWPAAPFQQKWQTDANFKRMLIESIAAAQRGELRVGVASHNLFDVALAMILADRAGLSNSLLKTKAGKRTQIQFEMLEGMANHQRRTISGRGANMLLYAPACHKEDFLHAIGYLIRRLDENTGPENFLRHSYRLTAEGETFNRLSEAFRDALNRHGEPSTAPRNTQDRRLPPPMPPEADSWEQFKGEPDTDWSLPHNADWIERLLDSAQHGEPTALAAGSSALKPRLAPSAQRLFAVSDKQPEDAGPTINESSELVFNDDVSRPGVTVCRYENGTIQQLFEAVRRAVQSDWPETLIEDRHALLRRVAQNLRTRRGELLVAMVAGAGKSIAQGDPEISEAIDFCEFYPLTMKHWAADPNISLTPRGVTAVITPWNFPLAIPVGGIAAALVAGNPVVFKPAGQTMLPALQLCEAFWDAGVPRSVLQLAPCSDEVAQKCLVENPSISTVILTGGTETAVKMLSVRPDLHLLAETGGKNATIVTAMADRDLAIKHVLQSAFGHSGQKCSATSLLLLQDEVFDDPSFRQTLRDAAQSLPVGSAWELDSVITPLVCSPNDDLRRGLTKLQDGESWLLEPRQSDSVPNLWSPGIKWNVRPGSFTHQTELFGPVLAVMRFGRLEQAIQWVRETGYGLTSGLESLDDREVALWRESTTAGNLYINRSTTGAIVLRQPFGGVGKSAYGPGAKAGGPHYVLSLCHVSDRHPDGPVPTPANRKSADTVTNSFRTSVLEGQIGDLTKSDLSAFDNDWTGLQTAVDQEFTKQHDTFHLIGQDNLRRYRPVDSMVIRVAAGASPMEVIVSMATTVAVGAAVTVSYDPNLAEEIQRAIESAADVVPSRVHAANETDDALSTRLRCGATTRVRVIGPATSAAAWRKSAAQNFVSIIDDPVVRYGRIEGLRYLNEQSISHDYHRYGNLSRRATEHSIA